MFVKYYRMVGDRCAVARVKVTQSKAAIGARFNSKQSGGRLPTVAEADATMIGKGFTRERPKGVRVS